VDNRDVLAERAGNPVEGRQLADTESRDDGRDSLDSGSTICGVCGIELVAITDPFEPTGFYGIELDSGQMRSKDGSPLGPLGLTATRL
jgi:hypothetical protein